MAWNFTALQGTAGNQRQGEGKKSGVRRGTRGAARRGLPVNRESVDALVQVTEIASDDFGKHVQPPWP